MDILRKYKKDVIKIIDMALKEDIGDGDITTDMIIPAAAQMKGVFIAKAGGIICGLPIAKMVFAKLDKNIRMTVKKKDGQEIKHGDVIASVRGKARAILTGERLALNILQRLSGVATSAAEFVKITKPYKVKILDTRKTTPNLRILEKYAVKIGGAENHRMGLYDAVLIKDNHLRLVELERSVFDLRTWLPKNIKIEVEVDDLEVLGRAIKAKPDIIMLDNMSLSLMDKALDLLKKSGCKAKIEVSGGIAKHNIRDIARKRIDYISIGSITHSPQALDISFKIDL